MGFQRREGFTVFAQHRRGRSWEAFPLPIVQGGAMTGAFSGTFRVPQQGWVMGGNWEDHNNRGNLAETHDGGETWPSSQKARVQGTVRALSITHILEQLVARIFRH